MAGRLTGKVAVITGGAQGIGQATATLYTRHGAAVVIGDIAAEPGMRTVAAIEAAGGRASFLRTDVTDEEQCRRLVAEAVDRYGQLDVLITCAGVFRGGYVPVDALDARTFRDVVDINLTGTFLCVKHAVAAMRTPGHGVILCVASGAGVSGPSGSFAYGASKGGVYGFVLTLQHQLEPQGIRVHAVCPGGIATTMKLAAIAEQARLAGQAPDDAVAAARGELGDPVGVARVLAFLASDEADYVRGTIFTR